MQTPILTAPLSRCTLSAAIVLALSTLASPTLWAQVGTPATPGTRVANGTPLPGAAPMPAAPAVAQPVPQTGPGATAASGPASAIASATHNGKLPQRGEPLALNVSNADIEAVARASASMTGRDVVVDPRVKGVMNLNTERPVPPAVAYNLFLATLRLQGYTVVEVGGLDKIVPEVDAKLQGGTVLTQPGPSNSGQLVTQIFKLNFESANNLIPILRPLISPNNTINVNPGTNALVITDYADNLQRIERIVAAMDVSNATDLEVVPLHNAIATDLAPLVLRLIESGGAAPAARCVGHGDDHNGQ